MASLIAALIAFESGHPAANEGRHPLLMRDVIHR